MKIFVKRLMVAMLIAAGLSPSVFADSGVTCRVDLDRDVVFANRLQTAIIKVTLDAPEAPDRDERPPVNLSIVLDRSGSMSGMKIQKAREAAIEALNRLNRNDVFSLIAYDNQVQTVIPAQRVEDVARMESRIRAIRTGGNTALFAGVSQGASEIREHLDHDYIHRILLLSDGLANVGPDSPVELGRLGTALLKEGISVSTIGIGTDYNEDLMTLMAQNSDGNTYFVESSRDLSRIFQAELGDVLSVVATTVEVTIEFSEGVRPLRFIGRDGRIGKNNAVVSLNQLYGGQEKYALIEVELPKSSEGDVRKVATAQCRYQNSILNQPGTSTAEATVRFSGSPVEVEESTDVVVLKEVTRNKIAIAKEQAVQFADEGDFTRAAKVMIGNASLASDFAEKYDDAELQVEAEELQDDADSLEQTRSLPKAKRKSFKASSFGVFRQQKSIEKD